MRFFGILTNHTGKKRHSLFLYSFLCLVGLSFFSPDFVGVEYAHAQGVDSEDVKENISPTTGSLMAAALETAGYAAQSQVLDHLGGMFESLGALLYVIMIIGAIFSVTVYGSYEGAAYLLIAPVFFFFVLNTRTVGYGAEWQWGIEDHTTTSEFSEAIGSIKNDDGQVVNRVSWIFHKYNVLISDFIQQGIKIVLNNDVNERVKPMARQQMLEFLFNADIGSPNLKSLIHLHEAHCSEEMSYHRQIALGNRHAQYRTTSYYRSLVEVDKGFLSERISVRPQDSAYPALEEIFASYRALDPNKSTDYGFPVGNAFDKCEIPESVPPAVSCKQVWCWMAMGLQTEVQNIQRLAEETHLGNTNDIELKKQIWKDIVIKLSDPKVLGKDDQNEYQAPSLDLIPVIIGGHLMKKEMVRSGNASAAISQFGKHAIYTLDSFPVDLKNMNTEQLQEFIRRYQKEQLSVGERWRIYTLAIYMPYVQGVILYILSLTFPFFALMLLVPGQVQGFLQWLGLWFWVKLWDLGWAFVIVVDDVIWEMMPHSANYDALKDPNDSPVTYFDAAFSGDPTHTLGMYYMVIGVMITGVPVVTAQFLLGSKLAVVNALMEGMNGIAQKFSQSMVSGVATNAAVNLEKLRMDHAMNHKLNSFKSDNALRLEGAADIATQQGADMRAQAIEAFGAGAVASALAGIGISGALSKIPTSKLRAALGASAGAAGFSASAGAGIALLEGAIKSERVAVGLRFEAFRINEMERLADSSRSNVEINLQGALGSVRNRIGHWFTRGSESKARGLSDVQIGSAQANLAQIMTQAQAEAVVKFGKFATETHPAKLERKFQKLKDPNFKEALERKNDPLTKKI